MIIGFDGSRCFVRNRTGTENYSYQLLKALAKIDLRNKYFVYVRNLPTVYHKLPTNFLIKKISWPRLWTQGGMALQTFKDKIDLLFVPSHTLPIVRKPGLKTVITVHDLGSEYLSSMHQLKQRIYLSYMQKHQLKTATKLIAVSKATKKDLVEKIGIKRKKIEVVYEGYDKEIFNSQFSIFKNDALVNSLSPYYLFVGTVQPRKNLERIIIAFSKVLAMYRTVHGSNNNLVIAGSKGWLSDEIYKLPQKLGIENKVKFLGYVSDEKLAKLYSDAKALLFPSLFEGFGLPILEAQASGCPVLTSNISSMPEVAGKGAILVNPYSVEDIASAMIKIMDQKIRQQLTKEGFENVKRFSWEKCARETLSILEEVSSRHVPYGTWLEQYLGVNPR